MEPYFCLVSKIQWDCIYTYIFYDVENTKIFIALIYLPFKIFSVKNKNFNLSDRVTVLVTPLIWTTNPIFLVLGFSNILLSIFKLKAERLIWAVVSPIHILLYTILMSFFNCWSKISSHWSTMARVCYCDSYILGLNSKSF